MILENRLMVWHLHMSYNLVILFNIFTSRCILLAGYILIQCKMIMLQNKALKFIYRLCELLFRKKKTSSISFRRSIVNVSCSYITVVKTQVGDIGFTVITKLQNFEQMLSLISLFINEKVSHWPRVRMILYFYEICLNHTC